MSTPAAFQVYNPVRGITYFAKKSLGQGGQACVWSGVSSAGLNVALKVMRATSDGAREYWAWHNDQTAHLECLNHPHVVVSYDQFRSPEGWYVLVMEPAQRSLDDVIATSLAQSALRVCAVGTHVLSALTYLHAIKRIHRDVSAKNLLEFPDGTIKLTDFGVSKNNIGAGEATGTQLGNAMYLPPELLNAGRWTHQSDIYQLGVVLISLLLGRHVIPPSNDLHTIRRMILSAVPRRTAESLAGTYGQLSWILSRMVCRTESLRYPTCYDAHIALLAEWNRLNATEKEKSQDMADAIKALGFGMGIAAFGTAMAKG